MLAALVYYLVPLLTNKSIAAPRLINWIFWLWVVFLVVNSVLMLTMGIVAGNAFVAGVTGPALGAIVGTYMMPIGIISIICAIVALMFVVQILVTVSRRAS